MQIEDGSVEKKLWYNWHSCNGSKIKQFWWNATLLSSTSFENELLTFRCVKKSSMHILLKHHVLALYWQYFICRAPCVQLEWNNRIAMGRKASIVPVSNDHVWPSKNNELFMVIFNKLKYFGLVPAPKKPMCLEKVRGKNNTRWFSVIGKAHKHINTNNNDPVEWFFFNVWD